MRSWPLARHSFLCRWVRRGSHRSFNRLVRFHRGARMHRNVPSLPSIRCRPFHREGRQSRPSKRSGGRIGQGYEPRRRSPVPRFRGRRHYILIRPSMGLGLVGTSVPGVPRRMQWFRPGRVERAETSTTPSEVRPRGHLQVVATHFGVQVRRARWCPARRQRSRRRKIRDDRPAPCRCDCPSTQSQR